MTGIEFDPDSITIKGDREEVRAQVQTRIEELTAALEEVDESDPQHELIRFELGTLIELRNSLEDEA